MSHLRRRSLGLILPLLGLLLAPRPALAQFSSAIQGTVTDAQKAVVADAVVMVTHTTSGVTREATTSRRRRVPRAQPRPRRLSGGGREAGLPQGAAGSGDRRHQRDGAARLHARSLGRAGERDRHHGAPLVETEQGRVSGPRRSPAAAGDAAQRPQPLQPDRAAARRDRQGRVRLDQRRRRRATTRSPANPRRASTPAASATRPTPSPSTTRARTASRAAASRT